MSEENKILSVWDKNYQEAKAFFKKYGRFPNHNDNVVIAQWHVSGFPNMERRILKRWKN